MMLLQLEAIAAEQKRYTGQLDGKPLRELYTKRIQEQEIKGKKLREQQKHVKENHEPNLRQRDMWRDLHEIFTVKVKERQSGATQSLGHAPALEEEDRLVL